MKHSQLLLIYDDLKTLARQGENSLPLLWEQECEAHLHCKDHGSAPNHQSTHQSSLKEKAVDDEARFSGAKFRSNFRLPRQYSKELDQTPAVDSRAPSELAFEERKPISMNPSTFAFPTMSIGDIQIREPQDNIDLPEVDITTTLLFDLPFSPPIESPTAAVAGPPCQPANQQQAIQRLLEVDIGEDDYDLIPDFEHLELSPTLEIGQSLFTQFPPATN